MKKALYLIILFLFFQNGFMANANDLIFRSGSVRIVMSDKEPASLKMAVESLCKDFQEVMLATPVISDKLPAKSDIPVLVVVNRAVDAFKIPRNKKLDDFESHRVWADPATNRIYLEGFDMRGTIFAIYTFSEHILGVPPLKYWCSWEPNIRNEITVFEKLDLFFKSPQVRFRAWVPNDTDLFDPWRRLSEANNNLWMETMLRLKLNTVEGGSVGFRNDMSAGAHQVSRFGMVITSHHTIALNSSIGQWDRFWEEVHNMKPPPELSLANEDKLIQFWRYCAETVSKSGMENLWNISFRGNGDRPFWSTYPDAPEDEKERGKIITKMLNTQMSLIREYSGEKAPYVRITFYDEMADFLAKGYVTPPAGENMIWTYVAGRRDHYPYDDIQQLDPSRKEKLGYYMNFQFTSTGAHLAPAEGPWKMEFNYRYVNDKSPLWFSVVNAGNLREFLFNLSANAKMLWDYNAYSSDAFAREYAAQYFGKEHADEIAHIYKDYFYAYWQQKKPDFPGGMERQYIFQDHRHARAIGYISGTFFEYTPNPLPDLFGFERVPGRVFRVVPADHGVDNQVDALLVGMDATIPKFADVAVRCEKMLQTLPANKRLFFVDNIAAYSRYMEHFSRSLRHYVLAYKEQSDKETLILNLNAAIREMEMARNALFSTQHGAFKTWYVGERLLGINDIFEKFQKTKEKALEQ